MKLPPGSIFICYRRDDSADVAGRIDDRLTTRFGREGVFRDLDAIPIGVDFRSHIQDCLSHCRVGLVIIGQNWTNAALPEGTIRLQDPADHVRIEIETMLSRKELVVVPVYVGGAETLRTNQLAESLHPLVYRNAVQVRRDPDFHYDMDRLSTKLEKTFAAIENREKEERERAEAARKAAARRGLTLPNLFSDLAGRLSGASLDLGIDLGTANTVIYKKDSGIVLREPSIVAVDTATNRVVAVGDEARRLLVGHPAGVLAIRPVKDGVVGDVNIIAAMLTRYISNVRHDTKGRPRLSSLFRVA